MSRHDDRVCLAHMRDHAQTALDIMDGKSREDLESELTLRYALLHLVCIIGEAANRVSESGQEKYGDIAWRDIIGTRNRLIHGY